MRSAASCAQQARGSHGNFLHVCRYRLATAYAFARAEGDFAATSELPSLSVCMYVCVCACMRVRVDPDAEALSLSLALSYRKLVLCRRTLVSPSHVSYNVFCIKLPRRPDAIFPTTTTTTFYFCRTRRASFRTGASPHVSVFRTVFSDQHVRDLSRRTARVLFIRLGRETCASFFSFFLDFNCNFNVPGRLVLRVDVFPDSLDFNTKL